MTCRHWQPSTHLWYTPPVFHSPRGPSLVPSLGHKCGHYAGTLAHGPQRPSACGDARATGGSPPPRDGFVACRSHAAPPSRQTLAVREGSDIHGHAGVYLLHGGVSDEHHKAGNMPATDARGAGGGRVEVTNRGVRCLRDNKKAQAPSIALRQICQLGGCALGGVRINVGGLIGQIGTRAAAAGALSEGGRRQNQYTLPPPACTTVPPQGGSRPAPHSPHAALSNVRGPRARGRVCQEAGGRCCCPGPTCGPCPRKGRPVAIKSPRLGRRLVPCPGPRGAPDRSALRRQTTSRRLTLQMLNCGLRLQMLSQPLWLARRLRMEGPPLPRPPAVGRPAPAPTERPR